MTRSTLNTLRIRIDRKAENELPFPPSKMNSAKETVTISPSKIFILSEVYSVTPSPMIFKPMSTVKIIVKHVFIVLINWTPWVKIQRNNQKVSFKKKQFYFLFVYFLIRLLESEVRSPSRQRMIVFMTTHNIMKLSKEECRTILLMHLLKA